MNGEPPDYRAYLLRLWYARDDGDCWRASLEDAGTRELRMFADVDALICYLNTLIRPVGSKGLEAQDNYED